MQRVGVTINAYWPQFSYNLMCFLRFLGQDGRRGGKIRKGGGGERGRVVQGRRREMKKGKKNEERGWER